MSADRGPWLVPADPDRRLVAFAIDRAVAGTAEFAAAALGLGSLGFGSLGFGSLGSGQPWAAGLALLGAVLFVEAALAVLLGLTGASPGNLLAALRVVEERSGGPIGVPAAMGRQALLGVTAAATVGLGVAALAWTATTDPAGRRRGWHDQLVGSIVIDARPARASDPDPAPADPTEPRHVVNLTALGLLPGLSPGPSPAPRWRLGFDTGESFVVEGLVLVGRRPVPRPGEPVRHLVSLPSADMSLSQTHAQLQVAADGALVVMDRGSTNGSVLVRGLPRALSPKRAATLLDGDRLRLGDREVAISREA